MPAEDFRHKLPRADWEDNDDFDFVSALKEEMEGERAAASRYLKDDDDREQE